MVLGKGVVEFQVYALVRLMIERQVQRKVDLLVSALLDFVNHLLVELNCILQGRIEVLWLLITLKLVLDLIVIKLHLRRTLLFCILTLDVLVGAKKVLDFVLHLWVHVLGGCQRSRVTLSESINGDHGVHQAADLGRDARREALSHLSVSSLG